MAELEPIDAVCAVVRGPVNIGVVRTGPDQVALVDTGLGRDAARKVLRLIAEAGWGTVADILTTHAHADHVGGHGLVVSRTGAAVWAPPIDAAIIARPDLAPDLLWGASAPAFLRGRFIQAEPVAVHHVIAGTRIRVGERDIDVVPLAGHSPNQVGFAVGRVLFCADALLPPDALERHPVPFFRSIADQHNTLDRLLMTDFDHYVPGHGPVMDRDALVATVAANRKVLDDIARLTHAAVRSGDTTESIIACVLAGMNDPATEPAALALSSSTVRATLTWLSNRGEIEAFVEGGLLRWRAVPN